MITAGARLSALAGLSGAASALLSAIGSGATAAAALVAFSGLATGTAAQHLMTEPRRTAAGGVKRRPAWRPIPLYPYEEPKPREEDEAVLMALGIL